MPDVIGDLLDRADYDKKQMQQHQMQQEELLYGGRERPVQRGIPDIQQSLLYAVGHADQGGFIVPDH